MMILTPLVILVLSQVQITTPYGHTTVAASILLPLCTPSQTFLIGDWVIKNKTIRYIQISHITTYCRADLSSDIVPTKPVCHGSAQTQPRKNPIMYFDIRQRKSKPSV